MRNQARVRSRGVINKNQRLGGLCLVPLDVVVKYFESFPLDFFFLRPIGMVARVCVYVC